MCLAVHLALSLTHMLFPAEVLRPLDKRESLSAEGMRQEICKSLQNIVGFFGNTFLYINFILYFPLNESKPYICSHSVREECCLRGKM